MKNLIFTFFLILAITFPSSAFASHLELKECIEISHCVREEINVEKIDKPFSRIKEIVENYPRTNIVDVDGDYLHAEVTSKIMKYVDDLEISYSPEDKTLTFRSESRVGEGDFGVNKKRVESLKKEFLS